MVSPAASAAGVYRWADEQGNVHYGDRPPTQSEPTSVEIKAAPAPAPEDSERRARTQRLLDAIESERAQQKADAGQAKADKVRQEQTCQAARRRLAFYERANTLFRRGADGERTYLSESERAKALSQARSQVSKWCK